jgi:hypothetical protein
MDVVFGISPSLYGKELSLMRMDEYYTVGEKKRIVGLLHTCPF